MARGWESKAVEAQIEGTEREAGDRTNGLFSPSQVEIRQKREGLLLSRARVLQDMQTARNPRYRKLLQDTLDHLEHELELLEKRR
jgi:hypothetical protein